MPENAGPAALILIIDDEPLIQASAGLTLKRAGFRVLHAEDGPTGIELFRQHTTEVDAVLLDLTLPAMSGEAVFGALQGIRPDVRVVLSSGHHPTEIIGRLLGQGLAGIIQKPYRPAALVAKINTVLYDYSKATQLNGDD